MRERLSRRGLAPVASGIAAALPGESRAAVPQELVHSTIRSTTLGATGVYPAAVSALVRGTLRTMTMTKLCKVSCTGIVLGMAGIVGGTFIPAGDRPQAGATTVVGESRNRDPRSDLDQIQGTWIRVSTDGRRAEKPLRTVVKKATDRPDVDVPAGATVFDFNWEGGHNHALVDPTKDPKTLDFLPEPRGEGVPKICPGIYNIEGDVLTICFLNVNGKRPTRFVAGGFGETLDVYERVNLPESQQPAAETKPSEKPRGDAAGDRRWVATLSNGATIEVIGVSSYPTGPDTWWRPDRSRCLNRRVTRPESGSAGTGTSSTASPWSASPAFRPGRSTGGDQPGERPLRGAGRARRQARTGFIRDGRACSRAA